MTTVIYCFILSSLLFGMLPPNIPDAPICKLWMPATFTYPGKDLEIRTTFGWVQEKLEIHGFNTDDYINGNSIEQFLSMFIPDNGYVLLMSHGGELNDPAWLMVEAYEDQNTALQRLAVLQAQYPNVAELMSVRIVQPFPGQPPIYYGICVESYFLEEMVSISPDFVFVSTCYSAVEEAVPSICDAFRRPTGASVGWLCAATMDEGIYAPFCTFYHMAGWSVSPETYKMRNKSVSEAVSEYQDHYTNHPNRYHLLIEGDNQMKFYNSPRIVGLKVKQAGKIIYRYHFDQQSYYPYEWDYPGDLSGCPKNPAVVGNQPLEVKILFSAPMNPEAIQLQIKAEQGNFVIPVNGNWGSYVFNNDLWTGACDFSE
jgi:hypothetical protein